MSTQPFSEMEPNWLSEPDTLGHATMAVAIALGVISFLLVVLRSIIRFQTSTFGLDDGLMVIGMLVYTACCVFTCLAVYAGVGTTDDRLKPWNKAAGTMYVIYFQITYAWSLPFIKSSVCLTMLRIITEKKLRFILWASLVASVASAMVGFISVVALCKPIELYWDPAAKGWCAKPTIVTGMSYLVSVMSVLTDWTCSLLPCYVVWNLQMQPRLKASVCAVLALGIVASAATIIRLPYLRFYNIPTNYHYNVANIVVWSIVECGIAIICGSLPSLRTLFKAWLDKSLKGSYGNSSYKMGKSGGKSGGGAGRADPGPGGSIKMGYLSKGGGYSTKISAPARTQGEWVELDDDTGSEKRMITRTVEISVDVGNDTEAGHSRG